MAKINQTSVSRLCGHNIISLLQTLPSRRRVIRSDVARLAAFGIRFHVDTRHQRSYNWIAWRNPRTTSNTIRRCFTSPSSKQSPIQEAVPKVPKVDASSPPDKSSLLDTTQSLKDKVKNRISNLTPHENIYNIPNFLTVSRLLATPAIGYFVLHDQHVWAVSLFAYAGITDLVDGWVARRWNLQTVAGSVIDPMADKFLMTVLVACLAIKGALPVSLAVLIFGRDMSLGFGAIYYRYASLPTPKTFMRYWDFSIPSAEVHPTTVSKWNTFLQLGLIGATTTLPLLTSTVLPAALASVDFEAAVRGMQYVVAGTTLWSGASYLWTKDAVRILGKDEELKRKQGFRGRMILGVSMTAFLGLAAELWRREEEKKNGKSDKPL